MEDEDEVSSSTSGIGTRLFESNVKNLKARLELQSP